MTAQHTAITASRRVRLSADDFLLLEANGAFDSYHKTELLDGEIYFMNAQHRRHAMVKADLYDAVRDRLRDIGSPLRAVPEASVGTGSHDIPQPDIFLTNDPYGDGVFPGSSIALVIEVADSTQRRDLGKKAKVYARGRVAEYWVLDTKACIAHQHWAPEGTAYTQRREITFGQPITAETIPGLTVTLPE